MPLSCHAAAAVAAAAFPAPVSSAAYALSSKPSRAEPLLMHADRAGAAQSAHTHPS